MANTILYGFTKMKDLFDKRVQEVGIDVVSGAIDATVTEHNRQMAAFRALFAEPTIGYSARFKTPTATRLQPMDEAGRARPIKPAGQYDVAFPIQEGAAAWGETYLGAAKMTVAEANDYTATLLGADFRWMRDHIFAALFANASWTFTDEEHGSLTVKGLANGDTDTYLIQTGADAGATDTHYLAQAVAIDDSNNPFPTIADELEEHPENAGEVISFIPANLRTSVMGLANFKEPSDPNIAASISTDRLVGRLGTAVPGKLLGYVDGVWVVEWKAVPDSYILATMAGGIPPLRMRQEPESSLQGFIQVATMENYPFYQKQWIRRAGFGAYNRVGALVYRIGNASYAVPTNYGSPMP